MDNRFDDLAPDKTREERIEIAKNFARYCEAHENELFAGGVITHATLTGAGFKDGETIDSRLIFLFTAIAYLNSSILSQLRGHDDLAMLKLFDAFYFFGFQDSGDLRQFIEDDAMERVFKSERSSTAAQKKFELREPIRKRARELLDQRNQWSSREAAMRIVGAILFQEFGDHFRQKNPDEDKDNEKGQSRAMQLVKAVIAELPNPEKRFARKSNKRSK